MATPAGSQYPIRAVSKMTGLPIDTLRAWERRYGAVTPSRDERGRLYSDADVRRLRLLRTAVAQGHAIGRIAALDDTALERLSAGAAAHAVPPADRAPGPARHVVIDTRPLIAALERFDGAAAEREFGRLSALLRPVELLRDVIMPVLGEVGDSWHNRRGRIAQEHLMSAIVRNVLGAFLRLHNRADGPARLVFATPGGERHEFGTLGAAMLAASAGLSVLYLGPDLPPEEIADGARLAGADVVALGVTAADHQAPALVDELRRISQLLPDDVELWMGGSGAPAMRALVPARVLTIDGYTELERHLARIGGSL